jgi:hypothetical protein
LAIGYPKTKEAIDGMLGDVSTSVNRCFRRAVQLAGELNAYTDAQLTTAGYTAGEVAQLRSFVTDITQLNNIYTGTVTLGAVKDFRPSLRPLWGVLGDF